MSTDTFMHIGYTGTMLCVDPQRAMFAILLTNRVYPSVSHGLGQAAVGGARASPSSYAISLSESPIRARLGVPNVDTRLVLWCDASSSAGRDTGYPRGAASLWRRGCAGTPAKKGGLVRHPPALATPGCAGDSLPVCQWRMACAPLKSALVTRRSDHALPDCMS
eukprot:scaffold1054_cov366-Prasinococcus_capsulatus_cf.AAC.4